VTRWRLTLLNAGVLCTIVLLLAGFLYLVELSTTDRELAQLLTRTVQQEQEEDLVQILQRQEPTSDPPRPFSPAALQAFFLLVDTHVHLHEGAAYRIAGLPAQPELSQAWHSGTSDLRDVTLAGWHLRLLTVPVRDGRGTIVGAIQAYASLQARDAERERLLLVLLLGSSLGLGISVLAARLLASHALAPMWRAFEQQEQFVADASHKLRAPLTFLRADVEILKRALRLPSFTALERTTEQHERAHSPEGAVMLSATEREVLDEMEAEITQMSMLMSDLLTLARYDAGVSSLNGQVVLLAPLLTALTERLATQLTQAHLTLHLLLPEELHALVVRGDPSALRRLFLVLLHNAITYTPAGGQIWLEVR
jgi:signal transduction histidine kinase